MEEPILTQQKIDLKKEAEEYRKFVLSRNLLEVAVTFMLTNTFQKLVTSLSNNICMPVVNFVIGGGNNNWRTAFWEPVAGMKIEYGQLMGYTVEFIFTSIALYVIYHRLVRYAVDDNKPAEEKK